MNFLTSFQHTSHRTDAPFLSVANLSARYNGTVALEDVTFELGSGQRVAVVGPNGAGKSTLFMIIAGLMTPSAGVVRLAGSGPGHHICIGYVPQRPRIDWRFPVSVADAVMMGRSRKIGLFRRPQKDDWQYVDHCLDIVDMVDLAGRQIGDLSGGQQQRVFIARALAQESELMLMDEPLTGLDIASQQGLIEILDRLREQQVTVMVATHDLNRATSDYSTVMLLNRRLLGMGPADRVLTAENLLAAYGGHLHMVETADGMVVVGDTHCDGAC